MRKLQANWLFTIDKPAIPNGIVVVDEAGTILEIANNNAYSLDVEFFEGALTPGFVNAHCHIELSHLKGLLPEKVGLIEFLKPIKAIRIAQTEKIYAAIAQAEAQMLQNGIVAVADISNQNHSFKQKNAQNLYYHTFLEIFDVTSEQLEEKWQTGLNLYHQVPKNAQNTASISPHAPYTTTPNMLKKIHLFAKQNNCLVSLHNQESEQENLFFAQQKGAFFDLHQSIPHITNPYIQQTYSSSLHYSLSYLKPKNYNMVLVHNTFTSIEDLNYANQQSNNIYWCFCPNANLYIENKLPNFTIFPLQSEKIVVGTDSLASNWQLCILSELKTIQQNTFISTANLLQWATLNGAKLLGLQNNLGSLSIGKRPGIVHVNNINLENQKLSTKSTAQLIVKC